MRQSSASAKLPGSTQCSTTLSALYTCFALQAPKLKRTTVPKPNSLSGAGLTHSVDRLVCSAVPAQRAQQYLSYTAAAAGQSLASFPAVPPVRWRLEPLVLCTAGFATGCAGGSAARDAAWQGHSAPAQGTLDQPIRSPPPPWRALTCYRQMSTTETNTNAVIGSST
jgi:hypothetical protein